MKDILRIIPIGSGSTGNCIYVNINDNHFLIDMGISYKKVQASLNKRDIDLSDINGIFITHGHNDHIKACNVLSKHIDCNIYCHKSSLYALKDVELNKISLSVNEINIINDVKVKMIPVSHDYVYTFGYIFESKQFKLGYITDCGVTNDNILNELKYVDVLVIESNHDIEMLNKGPYPLQLKKRILSDKGHLSNEDCAKTIEYLYEYGTRNFLLAHLSKHNNTEKIVLDTIRNRINKMDMFLYVCPEYGDDILEFNK